MFLSLCPGVNWTGLTCAIEWEEKIPVISQFSNQRIPGQPSAGKFSPRKTLCPSAWLLILQPAGPDTAGLPLVLLQDRIITDAWGAAWLTRMCSVRNTQQFPSWWERAEVAPYRGDWVMYKPVRGTRRNIFYVFWFDFRDLKPDFRHCRILTCRCPFHKPKVFHAPVY